MAKAPEDTVRAARRGLIVYFAVLVPLVGLLEARMLRNGQRIEDQGGLVFLLMWSPAFASLVSRLVLWQGIRDVSFRFGGKDGLRMLGIAWLYPVAVGGIAYGAAWGLGLAPLKVQLFATMMPNAAPLVRLVAGLGVALTVGTLASAVSAFGEELGWRGYMLTRLIEARVPRPILASAIIWYAYHVPLIVSGQYAAGAHPLLSAALFGLTILPAGFLAAYLRLRSGSVWPAVIFHASWNVVIQNIFDDSTAGASDWVGESGIFVVLVSGLMAIWIVRGRWTTLRSPGVAVAR